MLTLSIESALTWPVDERRDSGEVVVAQQQLHPRRRPLRQPAQLPRQPACAPAPRLRAHVFLRAHPRCQSRPPQLRRFTPAAIRTLLSAVSLGSLIYTLTLYALATPLN